jgi:hypothetical protein
MNSRQVDIVATVLLFPSAKTVKCLGTPTLLPSDSSNLVVTPQLLTHKEFPQGQRRHIAVGHLVWSGSAKKR